MSLVSLGDQEEFQKALEEAVTPNKKLIDLDEPLNIESGSIVEGAIRASKVAKEYPTQFRHEINEIINENVGHGYGATDIIETILQDISTQGDLTHIYEGYLTGKLPAKEKFSIGYKSLADTPRGEISSPHFIFEYDSDRKSIIVTSPLLNNKQTRIIIGPTDTLTMSPMKGSTGFGIVIDHRGKRMGIIFENILDSASKMDKQTSVKIFNGRDKKTQSYTNV